MTNETTQTKEKRKSLMDVPIKDNPKVYFAFHEYNAGEADWKEKTEATIRDLTANPTKYYAAILPGLTLCHGLTKIGEAIAQATSIRYAIGFDCCSEWEEEFPATRRYDGRFNQSVNRIEGGRFVEWNGYESLPTKSAQKFGERTLRSLLAQAGNSLKGEARERREDVIARLEKLSLE